ncbi:MAG: tetratricopeptide repeat protein [Pyrinomonadaceae bacterium]
MSIISGALDSIKNRLFLLSAVIGAGAAASFALSPDHGAGVALAVGLQTLAGLAANIGASEVYTVVSKRISHEDVLRNSDLSKAVRDAIRAVLLDEAGKAADKEDREALRTIADTDAETWELVETLQSDALEEISAGNLAEMFSKTPEEFASIKALDAQSWRELLRALEKKRADELQESVWLSEETRNRIAERLHEDFPHVLYEILKHDFATDGRAYSGLMLQLAGRIAGVTDKTLANTEEILKLLRQSGLHIKRGPSLCNLPHQPNQFFTGRESYLAELEKELNANARAALCGMPGVGKTQTAVEYAYRRHAAQAYDYVFYVHAASIGELLRDFAIIAGHLSLPVKDEQDFNRMAAGVKAWFENEESRWLLIFDNADDLTALFSDGNATEKRHNYIPASRRGHVLLTRRLSDAGSFGHTIGIMEMNEDEGALLLLRRAGYLDPKSDALDAIKPEIAAAARSIALEVGGLPLALDIAGAFIKETKTPPAEYLNEYSKEGKSFREERDASDPYSHSVAKVFSLAFERVAATESDSEDEAAIARAAADLLRLCAFVAPDAIPLENFTAAASELGDDLSRAMGNGVMWAKTKRRVLRFSLLNSNADDETFDTHRLVQAVIRDEMDDETQCLWTERAVRLLNEIFPMPDDVDNWDDCDLLLPHALDSLAHGRRCNLKTVETARLVNTAAYHLESRARYAEAEPLYQLGLEIDKELLGEKHPNTATSLNNLAELYRVQGRYEEAELLHQQALEIRKKVLAKKHSDIAQSLNNLALVYKTQGRYEEAGPLYQQSLEIRKEVSGDKHPLTASSLNNLAGLYYAQGRYEEAEPLYQQALEIRKEVLGDKHPDTAQSLNNLAELYRTQGRYEDAEPLYQQALEICKEVLGEKHPYLALSFNNLALLYYAQGRYEEAELMFKRALEIVEQTLGVKHPYSVLCRENLSGLQKEMAARALRREKGDGEAEDEKD